MKPSVATVIRPQESVVQEFVSIVVASNPIHAHFLRSSLDGMSVTVRRAFVEYLGYCRERGLSVEYLSECYTKIVNEMRSEQLYFLKNKRYRHNRFSDVSEKVYFDPTYMRSYMYGLALTSFLWPNHAAMFEFFERTFPREAKGAYLEVGPGHGYFLKCAANFGQFEKLVGVDVSPTSVAMTRDILAYSGLRRQVDVNIIECNFLDFAKRAEIYSCIVMGEVLEHVEEPARFLDAIARLSDPATYAFVTTCINSPAVDHIFHFRSSAQVEDLLRSSGFDIVNSLYVPHAGKTLTQCEQLSLSVNAAYVLALT